MTQARHPTLRSSIVAGRPRGRRIVTARPARSAAVDTDPLAIAMAYWWIEYRAGRRRAEQLGDLASRALVMRLRHRGPKHHRRLGPIEVIAVTTDEARPDRRESVVLIRVGQRTLAVMISIGLVAGAWRVQDITTPGDGPDLLDRCGPPRRRAIGPVAPDRHPRTLAG